MKLFPDRDQRKAVRPSTLTRRERQHVAFVHALNDRKLATYTDGGPSGRGRWKRREKARAAKQARKRQRR